jgi:hypothetical protein
VILLFADISCGYILDCSLTCAWFAQLASCRHITLQSHIAGLHVDTLSGTWFTCWESVKQRKDKPHIPVASRPALGRKRGMPGLSRMRGGGEAVSPAPGRRPLEAHGEPLLAHHACSTLGLLMPCLGEMLAHAIPWQNAMVVILCCTEGQQ